MVTEVRGPSIASTVTNPVPKQDFTGLAQVFDSAATQFARTQQAKQAAAKDQQKLLDDEQAVRMLTQFQTEIDEIKGSDKNLVAKETMIKQRYQQYMQAYPDYREDFAEKASVKTQFSKAEQGELAGYEAAAKAEREKLNKEASSLGVILTGDVAKDQVLLREARQDTVMLLNSDDPEKRKVGLQKLVSSQVQNQANGFLVNAFYEKDADGNFVIDPSTGSRVKKELDRENMAKAFVDLKTNIIQTYVQGAGDLGMDMADAKLEGEALASVLLLNIDPSRLEIVEQERQKQAGTRLKDALKKVAENDPQKMFFWTAMEALGDEELAQVIASDSFISLVGKNTLGKAALDADTQDMLFSSPEYKNLEAQTIAASGGLFANTKGMFRYMADDDVDTGSMIQKSMALLDIANGAGVVDDTIVESQKVLDSLSNLVRADLATADDMITATQSFIEAKEKGILTEDQLDDTVLTMKDNAEASYFQFLNDPSRGDRKPLGKIHFDPSNKTEPFSYEPLEPLSGSNRSPERLKWRGEKRQVAKALKLYNELYKASPNYGWAEDFANKGDLYVIKGGSQEPANEPAKTEAGTTEQKPQRTVNPVMPEPTEAEKAMDEIFGVQEDLGSMRKGEMDKERVRVVSGKELNQIIENTYPDSEGYEVVDGVQTKVVNDNSKLRNRLRTQINEWTKEILETGKILYPEAIGIEKGQTENSQYRYKKVKEIMDILNEQYTNGTLQEL